MLMLMLLGIEMILRARWRGTDAATGSSTTLTAAMILLVVIGLDAKVLHGRLDIFLLLSELLFHLMGKLTIA